MLAIDMQSGLGGPEHATPIDQHVGGPQAIVNRKPDRVIRPVIVVIVGDAGERDVPQNHLALTAQIEQITTNRHLDRVRPDCLTRFRAKDNLRRVFRPL
jgi:hypothetical protein